MLFRKYSFTISIIAILAISFFLRAYKLEKYPLPVNQDELSNVYDGYSIAETGADRWGVKHPVLLTAFGAGDDRPPLYGWICALSVKLFGFSVFSARFPSAVLGLLSLLFLFLASKKIGGKLFSFLVLLLAAVSPWHLLFSRMGLEAATLTSFFLILSVYLWITAKEKKYNIAWIIPLGLVTGLGTSTYQSSKLIFCLLAIILFIDIIRHSVSPVKKAGLFCVFLFIGVFPQLLAAFLFPDHFFARAGTTMMDFSFSFDYLNAFLKNFFSNLTPDYLFFSFGEYNNLSLARLLLVEFPFFYLGLFFLSKVIRKTEAFNPVSLYLLLAISIFPSALTNGNPNALRASCLMILFPLFTASGILFIFGKIKNRLRGSVFISVIALLVLANAVFYIGKYTSSIDLRNKGQQNFLVSLCEKLNGYKDNYSRIYIEEVGQQPNIYVASYCNLKPVEFQKAEKNFDPPTSPHLIQLGKYFFLDRNKIINEVEHSPVTCLFILQSRENSYHLIDSSDNGFKKFFFYEKQTQNFQK
jgi:4-amino-4-deoxy-L-arabinose transferase-like glycosyltransferase